VSIFAAFFLGLAGSLHCAAMCGPLTLALFRASGGNGPGKTWPWLYHGGRLVMYMVLGAISGAAGSILLWAGLQRWLSIMAGAWMLVAAIILLRGGAHLGGSFNAWLKSRFGFLLQERSVASTISLGALNGLLPCGLVYLAVAAAAATGRIAGGVMAMLAFGAGTLPMMFGVHFAGRLFKWGGPVGWRRTGLVFAALAGGLLIVRGMSLGIPYLSPLLVDGHTALCGGH
jgi:sulfite exporter TauE/SafE